MYENPVQRGMREKIMKSMRMQLHARIGPTKFPQKTEEDCSKEINESNF